MYTGFADWLDHISDVEVLVPKNVEGRPHTAMIAPSRSVVQDQLRGGGTEHKERAGSVHVSIPSAESKSSTDSHISSHRDTPYDGTHENLPKRKSTTSSGHESGDQHESNPPPSNIDLASIRAVYKEEVPSNKELDGIVMCAAGTSHDSEIFKEPLGAGLDGFVLTGVLRQVECERLIRATESMGFSFWNPESQRRDYRNADTVEVTHEGLAQALWARIKHLVVPEVTIRAGTARHSKELEGTWVAVGMNPNMLFNRYGAGMCSSHDADSIFLALPPSLPGCDLLPIHL